MTSPLAGLFLFTSSALGRCCHYSLSKLTGEYPHRQSRPVPSRSAVGKSLAVAPWCGLAGWSLHSRTKWQRKKSADLTTALPSRHSDRLGFHTYAFDLPVYAAFNDTFTASCSVDCAHQNWNLKLSLLRYIKHYLVAKIKRPISLLLRTNVPVRIDKSISIYGIT